MAASKLLALERTALLSSKVTKGGRPAIYTERPFQSGGVSTGTSWNNHPTRLQSRSLATAAESVSTAATSDVAQQAKFLRRVAAASPFVNMNGAPPEDSEFKFPLATLFKAPTREVGLAMAGMYAQAIREYGIVGIEIGWQDPESRFILELVDQMGCKPDTHSSTQGALWDVKYKPEGVFSEGTGKQAVSISHSIGEFAWHTDGAFEENPTRFFGFHIIHPDKEGGGVFRILRAEDLTKLLSPEAVQTLTNYEFDLSVPPEFFKGKKYVKGKLLDVDPVKGRAYVRFRKDILHDPPSSDAKANAAVQELQELLDNPESVGEHVPGFAFKENTVLLMDNARYLHSRTNIKDPKRWLRRVRFHGTPWAKKKNDAAA